VTGTAPIQWQQTLQLWETIPKTNLAVIPNCAHAVHLEKPALFNMIVGGFLEKSSR
jgi:pimeloyl-ACP methyl ester carboxylesterase